MGEVKPPAPHPFRRVRIGLGSQENRGKSLIWINVERKGSKNRKVGHCAHFIWPPKAESWSDPICRIRDFPECFVIMGPYETRTDHLGR